MTFGLTSDQKMLQDMVRKLHEKHAPRTYIRDLERDVAYPYDLYQAWVDAGLFGVAFPEQYGGTGGSIADLALVVYEIAYCSIDFQMAFGGGVFCGLNILRKGTDEQKAYWLPKLISGERKMSISISEPGAGSDVSAITTRAVRDGNGFVVNGQKVWNTGAGARDLTMSVYLKTDPAENPRKGMSLFLIDNDTPGVKFNKLDMLGRRCTGTYEVFFTDVKVDDSRIIGGENKGWDCLLSGLQVERIVSAAGNCGAAQACVDLASAYAKERKQFGRVIGSNQAIAHMLADMQTEVTAAWALLWTVAGLVSAGEDSVKEIMMAKLKASETYASVANMGMQIMGGFGYNKEFDMERHYRDARASTIAAGTSQIQRNLIAGMMGHKVQ
jgi:alkylation response protein AidB-like acyl-CoA dehydrogenase